MTSRQGFAEDSGDGPPAAAERVAPEATVGVAMRDRRLGTAMTNASRREAVPESLNPLGINGIEFVEFATSKPQALGGVLEKMGFRPIARHRSREVELYRQGPMNIIVNSQPADVPRTVQPVEAPIISAFAIRVRDAEAAFRRALDLGAWDIPVRARAMELNIPAIHGVGESLIYFVDRYDEFSIYDIDFRAIPTVEPNPPAIGGLRFFGIVQYAGVDRTADWVKFYSQIFGFTPLPDRVRFGIMPMGLLLQSPCHGFFLQLIEPQDTARYAPFEEHLQRIGFGTPDVLTTVATLEKRGIEFLTSEKVRTSDRGALTKPCLTNVMFELVHDEPGIHAAQR
jgi:4-hydroxyphenylpyruvate dioxygenase